MYKKITILLSTIFLALTIVVFSGCGDDDKILEDTTGGSTLMAMPDSGDVTTNSALDNLFIAHGALINSGSFTSTSSGQSVAFGVTQDINATRTVIGESVFRESISLSTDSSIVSVEIAEQQVVSNGNYIIRNADKINNLNSVDWADTAYKVSQSDYIQSYGYTPNSLSGMILNAETITSAEFVSQSSNEYTYKYTLDVETAPVYILAEMKTASGSSSYPNFKSAELYVTMDANWGIISCSTDYCYDVQMGLSFECNEKITETFSNIGQVTALPESAFFAQYADSDITPILPTEPSNLDTIIAIFGDNILGTDLCLQADICISDTLSINAELVINIDIYNLDDIYVGLTLYDVMIDGISLDDITVIYQYDTIYIDTKLGGYSITASSVLDIIDVITPLLGFEENESSSTELDINSILNDIIINNTDECTSLSLALDELGLSAVINATNSDDTYSLSDIQIAFGDASISLTPTDSIIDKPSCGDDYINLDSSISIVPTILELLDGSKDLMIVIDAQNTVYANIDIYNQVYKFALGDLRLDIVGRDFYLCIGDVLLGGDISEIEGYIEELSALSSQFFGEENMTNLDFASLLSGFDLSLNSILESLQITQDLDGTIIASFDILSVTATVAISNGDISINLPLGSKDLIVSIAEEKIEFSALDYENADVTIEGLFDDYMPWLENLVTSQGWTFDLDAVFAIDGVYYKLVDSSIDVLYYSAEEFSISATLCLYKESGNDFAPYLTIKVAIIDNVVYLSYSDQSNNSSGTDNSLDLSISFDAISNLAYLSDDLLLAVPELQELLDSIDKTYIELAGGDASIDYSQIIKHLSYVSNIFNVVIDGGMIVDSLGDINLSISKNGESLGLSLQDFDFAGFSIEYANVSVTGLTEPQVLERIGTYSRNDYMNLDSLEQLLSTFILTADSTSFHISGDLTANLSIGSWDAISFDVDIDLYVDILDTNDDNISEVYVSGKISREQLYTTSLAAIAFNDYGGDTYLYYDGLYDTISIVRNSYISGYCSKCNSFDCSSFLHFVYKTTALESLKGDPSYIALDIPSDEFMDNMLDYLMEMLNFSDTVVDAINGSSDDDTEGEASQWGFEDIILDFSYDNNTFTVNTDLTPISDDLGLLDVNIVHDDSDKLVNLYGDTDFISGLISIDFDLYLKDPDYGKAYEYYSTKSGNSAYPALW